MDKSTISLICVLSALMLFFGGGLMILGDNRVIEHWGVEAIELGKLMFAGMTTVVFYRATEP